MGWMSVGSPPALWIPACAGMTGGWMDDGEPPALWIPACAGMTMGLDVGGEPPALWIPACAGMTMGWMVGGEPPRPLDSGVGWNDDGLDLVGAVYFLAGLVYAGDVGEGSDVGGGVAVYYEEVGDLAGLDGAHAVVDPAGAGGVGGA